MTKAELLELDKNGERLETRAVTGTTLEDLDRRRLRDYFVRIRQQEVPPDEDRDGWKKLLVNTEIMTHENSSIETTASVAGLLLFGKNPKRFLPQSGIDAAAYPGGEKDYNSIERAYLQGAITPLLGTEGMVESGLVEEAIYFVRRNTKVEAYLENGARRRERRDYPEEAVREAVVNALVHRDYLLSGTNIELSIYSDRLEIVSPGRLPNGITPERMKTGCRSARNQLLKDIMRDYGYLEHMGMGIPRKIIKGMLEHNRTKPDLAEEGELFILRLRKGEKT